MIARKSAVGAALLTLTMMLSGCAATQAETVTAASFARACDRACLTRAAEDYLAAMVAHAPKRLSLTDDFRHTENGQTMALGDGLWGTIDGPFDLPSLRSRP
jgi:hypothetical protein